VTARASSGATARHRALAHPSRLRLLELLEAHPEGLEATTLAEAVGLHPNTVRLHLDKLVEAGLALAETIHPGGRGRPPTRYRTAEAGPDEDGYRLLSSVLATALATGEDAPVPAAEAAGRRWGRELATGPSTAGSTPGSDRDPTEAVTGLFDRLGFAPEVEGDRIVLHACPYRELARAHPEVICGAHLGLLRGALAVHGHPESDGWLQPFVTPTRCHAGLAGPDTPTEDRP
jgi:predicted ArsR family transcriptional regulator